MHRLHRPFFSQNQNPLPLPLPFKFPWFRVFSGQGLLPSGCTLIHGDYGRNLAAQNCKNFDGYRNRYTCCNNNTQGNPVCSGNTCFGWLYGYGGPTSLEGLTNACTCDTFHPQFYDCAPRFEYPWFSKLLTAPGMGGPFIEDVNVSAIYHNPPDSLTRRMFRLPVVDLSKSQCSASPFTNAGHAQDPGALRSNFSAIGFFTSCNDIMTQVCLVLSMYVCVYFYDIIFVSVAMCWCEESWLS